LPGPTLEPSRETREMDIALAMAFSFWDLVVAHKKPFTLPQSQPPAMPEAAAPQAAPPQVALSQAVPLALPPAEPPPKQLAEVVSIGPLFGGVREK
jgi:hypothetical protein